MSSKTKRATSSGGSRKTGFKYGDKAIESHAKKHKYILIQGTAEPSKGRTLSGAKGIWAKNPDIIYVPDLRLTGTRADIETFLKNFPAGLEPYRSSLDRAYTIDNVEGNAAYNQEIAAYDRYRLANKKAAKPKQAPNFTLADIPYLAAVLKEKSFTFEDKQGSAKTSATKSSSKKKATGGKGKETDLLGLMNAAKAAGEYRILTKKMDLTKFTGTKKGDLPAADSKKDLIQVGSLALLAPTGAEGLEIVRAVIEELKRKDKANAVVYDQALEEYIQAASPGLGGAQSTSKRAPRTTKLSGRA